MSVRLIHPQTLGEFDAADASVPHWLRSGWVPLAEFMAGPGAGPDSPAVTAPVTSTTKKAAQAAEVTADKE